MFIMLPLILPIVIAVFLIGWSVSRPYWRNYKRRLITQQPFQKDWRKILKKRIPYFRHMPVDLQLQLKQHIQIFIAEKKFIGCNGVVITDEIRVTIAAQACLLLLNRETNFYPNLTTILVYPTAFIKQQLNTNIDGVKFTTKNTLAGESWQTGKVILSWQDTLDGAEIPDDGHNVVIHEFAHQLDQENGSANGAPYLNKGQSYKTWSSVFNQQFIKLQQQAQHGIPSLFDYYGATNPAEFFAVASEVFFEQATILQKLYPALYEQLKLFYRVDPALW